MKRIYKTLGERIQTLITKFKDNFLLLSWSEFESRDALKSLLQEDLDRAKTRPLVTAQFKGESSIERMYRLHKEMRMPFKWIPSCSGFRKELDGHDWLFELFGVKVRKRNEQIYIRNWRNGGPNRYLFRMFWYLGKLRDEGRMKEYWKVGWRLMRNHAYQVTSFNYVFNNWHREKSLGWSLKVLERVKELAVNKSNTIRFHRTYIPKNENLPLAEGNARPLGVPNAEWRVYLHMINNLIVWSRTGKEGNQHAYFPGRGVATAWKEVLNNIDNWNYIYEFDLEKFFDKIDLGWNREYLVNELGYEVEDANFIYAMNQSIPTFKHKEDLVMEQDRLVLENKDGSRNQIFRSREWEEHWNDVSQRNAWLLSEIRRRRVNGESLEGLPPLVDSLSWENLKKVLPKLQVNKEIGVPQGAAPSCGLATINVTHLTDEGKMEIQYNINSSYEKFKCIMYADDGIMFCRDPRMIDSISNEAAGVKCVERKSRWLKVAGKWVVKEFKFLGLEYDVENKRLRAKTRKGATLELNHRGEFLGWLLAERENILAQAVRRQVNLVDERKEELNEEARLKAGLSKEQTQKETQKEEESDELTRAFKKMYELTTDTLRGLTAKGMDKPSTNQEEEKERREIKSEIEYGGSAQSLNSRVPESLRDWVTQEYATFVAYPNPLLKIFGSKFRGYFISRMYNNSWSFSPPQDFRLSAARNSWCKLRWPEFQYRSLHHLRKDETGPEYMDLWTKCHLIGNGLYRELNEIEREIPLCFSGQVWEEIPEEVKQRLRERFGKVRKGIQRVITIGSDGIWEDRIKLNIWNASTFACDDLLRNYPLKAAEAQAAAEIKKVVERGEISEQSRVKINEILRRRPGIFIRYYIEEPKRRIRKKVENVSEKVSQKLKEIQLQRSQAFLWLSEVKRSSITNLMKSKEVVRLRIWETKAFITTIWDKIPRYKISITRKHAVSKSPALLREDMKSLKFATIHREEKHVENYKKGWVMGYFLEEHKRWIKLKRWIWEWLQAILSFMVIFWLLMIWDPIDPKITTEEEEISEIEAGRKLIEEISTRTTESGKHWAGLILFLILSMLILGMMHVAINGWPRGLSENKVVEYDTEESKRKLAEAFMEYVKEGSLVEDESPNLSPTWSEAPETAIRRYSTPWWDEEIEWTPTDVVIHFGNEGRIPSGMEQDMVLDANYWSNMETPGMTLLGRMPELGYTGELINGVGFMYGA